MNIAKVLLIDDDLFVQSSIRAGLSGYGIKVIGTVSNILSALKQLEHEMADVVIVDLDLGPGPNGVDICHSLRKKYQNIGLILLTSYTNPLIADPNSLPLPKGCRFISKSNLSDFSILVNEVIATKNKPMASTPKIVNMTKLTNVQLEVLKMVANGLSSTEIAAQRGVSVKAIEGLIAKIHKSLGLIKSKSLNQRVQLTRTYFHLSGRKPPGE